MGLLIGESMGLLNGKLIGMPPWGMPWNCMQGTTLGKPMGLLKGSFIWALSLAILWTCNGASRWGVHGLAEWLAHWDATMGHAMALHAGHHTGEFHGPAQRLIDLGFDLGHSMDLPWVFSLGSPWAC